jgi:hypothetical protein
MYWEQGIEKQYLLRLVKINSEKWKDIYMVVSKFNMNAACCLAETQETRKLIEMAVLKPERWVLKLEEVHGVRAFP